MKTVRMLVLILVALAAMGVTLTACQQATEEPIAEPVIEIPTVEIVQPTFEVITEPITMTEGLTLTEGITGTEGITLTEGMTETAGLAPIGPAELMVATDLTLGDFLTDAAGRVVYMYTEDSPNMTTCTGPCLETWAPVLTLGDAIAGEGLDPTLLGMVTLEDGNSHVTYNGWPLYYYLGDTEPGAMGGQAMNMMWFVVSPLGEKVE